MEIDSNIAVKIIGILYAEGVKVGSIDYDTKYNHMVALVSESLDVDDEGPYLHFEGLDGCYSWA